MARVEFSLSEAVEVTGRSKSTLVRAVKAGKLPNAYKDLSGAWKLPVEDLIAAGYPPTPPEAPQAVTEPSRGVSEHIRELEARIELLQTKLAAEQTLRAEIIKRAENAERALLLLESSHSHPNNDLSTPYINDLSQPISQPISQPTSNTHQPSSETIHPPIAKPHSKPRHDIRQKLISWLSK